MDLSNRDISGILIQYPDTDGSVYDYSELVDMAHANGVGVENTFFHDNASSMYFLKASST